MVYHCFYFVLQVGFYPVNSTSHIPFLHHWSEYEVLQIVMRMLYLGAIIRV